MDGNARPPIFQKLHYVFDGWLGDDFLQIILTYVGTTRLAGLIQQMSPPVTGVQFDSVSVSKSREYLEFAECLPAELPDLVWFKITGTAGVDDFGIGVHNELPTLIISGRVLEGLKRANLNHCEIEEFRCG